MAGKEDQRCLHKRCWEFKHYPQYNSNTRSKAVNERTDFEWFKRVKRGRCRMLVPINPYARGSEGFREFKKLENKLSFDSFGDWPKDWDLFHRSEISIQFVQYAAFKYVFNHETNQSEKKWYIDVKEAACYMGPKLDSSHINHYNTYHNEDLA